MVRAEEGHEVVQEGEVKEEEDKGVVVKVVVEEVVRVEEAGGVEEDKEGRGHGRGNLIENPNAAENQVNHEQQLQVRKSLMFI